jgi:hypothetical protein
MVPVGYEYAIHEVFKDGTQSIPLVSDPIVALIGDLRHLFPRHSFKRLALKSEILNPKHETNPNDQNSNVQNRKD